MDSSARQLEIFQAQDLQRRAAGNTGFLDLPVELRLQIYRIYVPRNYVIFNNARAFTEEFDFVFYEDRALRMLRIFPQIPFTTDFLVVCKQVTEESLDVLYGENRFEMDLARGAQGVLREAFTERNIQRIKDLHVIAYLSVPPPDRRVLPQPDYGFWAMVIPHLTSFVLHANEFGTCAGPRMARREPDTVLIQYLSNLWKELIEPYFELFGRLLGGVDRNIKTDISVGSETLPLAVRHIPGNYHVSVVNRVLCICQGRFCGQSG